MPKSNKPLSSNLHTLIPQVIGTQIAAEVTARLGHPLTNKVKVTSGSQVGKYYIHGLGANPDSFYYASNTANVPEKYGSIVFVKRKSDGEWHITGLSPENAIYEKDSKGNDFNPIYRDQFISGGLAAIGTGAVHYFGTYYRIGDTIYETLDQDTGDFVAGAQVDTLAATIDMPTTNGMAKVVLVQIDPTDNSLSYKQSVEFNAGFSWKQIKTGSYMPNPDASNFVAGYVKLVAGQTIITQDNVLSLPDLFTYGTSVLSSNDIDNDSDVYGADLTTALNNLLTYSGTTSGTRGEGHSYLDLVYHKASDNKWYLVDTNASPPACSSVIAFAMTSGATDTTGLFQTQGTVIDFSGLTVGLPVYASTTPGGYTQTKPTLSLGGGQIVLIEVGIATTTETILLHKKPIRFMIADTLADDDTITIEHNTDASLYQRKVFAYLSSVESGATLSEYASSNQDADIYLEGLTMAGDSINTSASGGTSQLGDVSGNEYVRAQSFTTVNGGLLTQFTVGLSSNNNSPTGDVTWSIRANNSGDPDASILSSGTFTPTPSSTNTINLTTAQQITLSASTIYWIVFSVPAQATNNYYQIIRSTSSSYAGGSMEYSTDGGSSWTSTSFDLEMTVTISVITEKDKLAQSFQVAASTAGTAQLYLKKVGSPTGTMTLRVETDSAGSPSGSLVHANATATVSESSLSTSYGDIDFAFAGSFSLAGSTDYWLVLSTDRAQSDTNYVAWGADASSPSYADGAMKSELASSWSALSADAIFLVMGDSITFDDPATIAHWASTLEAVLARFDDGAGADASTNTTFKNKLGASVDLTCVVEMD